MFVRWQIHRSQALDHWHCKLNDERARFSAVLVETVRVDGRPRQQHIAFLGSTTVNAKDHLGFWCQVTERLDRLSNRLTPQDRKQIVAAIAKRLGRRRPAKTHIERRRQAVNAIRGRRPARPGISSTGLDLDPRRDAAATQRQRR